MSSPMVMSPAYVPLVPQVWDDKFFVEYVRESKFSRYMGTTEQSMFQVKEDLTRKPGDKITFAKVGKLIGVGVAGTATLEGNEEVLDQHAMVIQADIFRHGVAVTDWDEKRSAIDLRNAARGALKVWEMEKLKRDLTTGLLQVAVGTASDGAATPIAIQPASAGQRNTWVTNNQDRVLFGALKSNYSTTFATAAANVDSTNDIMSTGIVSLAKRMAQLASPVIRPIRTEGLDEEWYILWLHPYAFRDLRQDTKLQAAQQNALPRSEKNILFTGGDILWDGVICKELWELGDTSQGAAPGIIAAAGASGIDVSVNILCGAQAVGLAWAQRFKTTINDRDYNFRHGVGVQEARGIQKLTFGRHYSGSFSPTANDATPCDNGTLTVFASGVADA